MKKRDPKGFSDDSFYDETIQVTEQIMNVYNSGVVIPSAKLDEDKQKIDKLK